MGSSEYVEYVEYAEYVEDVEDVEAGFEGDFEGV